MTPHKTSHPTSSPAANPFASVLTGPLAGAMEKSATIFGKGLRRMQQEGLKFMTRRIEDNMKAAEKFGTCRSVPDLLAAQQQWLSDTARAYNEEWTRCSELMVDLTRDTSEPANGAAGEHSRHPH